MPRQTPASGVPSPRAPLSQRLAASLQDAPEQLDDVTRARLERNLIDAWRGRSAHAVALPKGRAGLSRAVWMGSLAASAALGVALGLFLLRNDHDDRTAGGATPTNAAQSVAHFDLVIGDGAVQSGVLVAGQVLESGKHGHIEVSVGESRLDIAPDSRVRFERLDREELRVSLVQGRVDVAFNPERKGEQQLSIETSTARVSVVGTRFAVEAAPNRETRVSVSEGVVRVQPRRGGAAMLVRAGEEVLVPAPAESAKQAQPAAAVEPQPEAAKVHATPVAEPTEPARTSARARRWTARSERSESLELRFENTRQLLLDGKHAAARDQLARMVKSSLPPSARVEALVLMAESFTAQGDVPRAAAAYRQAVDTAPREAAGHNALFALARLLDRYTQDNDQAAAAYREYLAKAPHGALARQSRDALCRLSKCR